MNTVIAAGVALQPKYVVDTPKGVVDSKNLFESKLHVGFIFIKNKKKTKTILASVRMTCYSRQAYSICAV